MAVAEPKHERGRPKKRTRIVPPPKGQKGPPYVEQSASAEQSMLVPKPEATPTQNPHKLRGKATMRPLKVAKYAGDDLPLQRLQKAAKKGEGARGGHIIGHTKSGKPIYDHRPATHAAYRGFTAGEHKEAADTHHMVSDNHHASSRELGDRLDRLTGDMGYDDEADRTAMYADEKKSQHHWGLGAGHARLAGGEAGVKKHAGGAADISAAPLRRLRKAAKRGEGTRGGKIIGHTKSGRPIYAAGDKNYHGLTPEFDAEPMARNGDLAIRRHPDFSIDDHLDAERRHGDNEHDHRLSSAQARHQGDEDLASAYHTVANHHQLAKLAHNSAIFQLGSRGHVFAHDRHPGSEFDYRDLRKVGDDTSELDAARAHNLRGVQEHFSDFSPAEHRHSALFHHKAGQTMRNTLNDMDVSERMRSRDLENQAAYHTAMAFGHADAAEIANPHAPNQHLAARSN